MGYRSMSEAMFKANARRQNPIGTIVERMIAACTSGVHWLATRCILPRATNATTIAAALRSIPPMNSETIAIIWLMVVSLRAELNSAVCSWLRWKIEVAG